MIDGTVVAGILEKVRLEKPLIHHLTNYVTMGDCAAITAAAGALPVMAQAEQEVEEMVAAARAAVINTGTLSPSRVRAMRLMGLKARELGIPVVFDPVGAGSTSFRSEAIMTLLREITPAIIKGNVAELSYLAGVRGVELRGTQTMGAGGDCLATAQHYMVKNHFQGVVAMTGPVDYVCAGKSAARIYNGSGMLPLVVGSGCMAASVIAAFAAVEKDSFTAAAAALSFLGVAAELAEVRGAEDHFGPAAFKQRWLDMIYLMTPEQLLKGVRVAVT